MNLSRAYNPFLHFEDDKGKPLSNGSLHTFVAGTNNPIATYNSNGTLNPVRIVLDSQGNADVWLDPRIEYKFKLYDSKGADAGTKDHVSSGSIPDNYIEVKHFANPLPLVAGDGIKLTPHDVGGTTVLVVELSDEVKSKLETM